MLEEGMCIQIEVTQIPTLDDSIVKSHNEDDKINHEKNLDPSPTYK